MRFSHTNCPVSWLPPTLGQAETTSNGKVYSMDVSTDHWSSLRSVIAVTIITGRKNEVWGKVIFLHQFVILFTGGVCVVAPGGHAWLLWGACMVLFRGHAWFYSRGMCGFIRGYAWFYLRGRAWFFQFFRIQ